MLLRIVSFAANSLIAAALCCVPDQAIAAPPGCTVIDSIPTKIDTPGTYCLARNLVGVGNAYIGIDIDSENVTLDCRGFSIEPAAGATGGYGVLADKSNVIVRNCVVRRYLTGIWVVNSGLEVIYGAIVEDNRVVSAGTEGIGSNGIIRRNIVIDTGGYSAYGSGISLSGWGFVADNIVDGVYDGPGEYGASGIYATAGGVIARNRVRNIDSDFSSGLQLGSLKGTKRLFGVAYDNVLTMTLGGSAVLCPEGYGVLRGNTVFGSVDDRCKSRGPVSMPVALSRSRTEPGTCRVISSLPAVIATRGSYCLAEHLSTAITAGNAVTINADDVTLDCLDRVLDGRAAGAATNVTGIAAVGRSNVIVRNCSTRGFRNGIRLLQAAGEPVPSGLVVEGNRILESQQSAVVVQGDASVIRSNLLTQVGVNGGVGAVAIVAKYTVDVVDNHLTGIVGEGATGIHVASGVGGTIAGNRMQLSGTNGTTGIRLMPNTQQTTVSANIISTYYYGGGTPAAVVCAGNDNRLRDNTALGFTGVAFDGCTDAGGNVQELVAGFGSPAPEPAVGGPEDN